MLVKKIKLINRNHKFVAIKIKSGFVLKKQVFSYFSLVSVLFGKECSDSLSNMKLSQWAFLLAAWYSGRVCKVLAAHWCSESLPVVTKAF